VTTTALSARQVWLHGFPVPSGCETTAVQAERLGFDGLLLADSQNLVGDVFVELGVLTRATHRLGLGTGVINPLTRHPAVTAAAIASLQLESGGRAVLGVGRGDSSLAQLGLVSPSTGRLREFVSQVRGFLHGETVSVDGRASRIGWITDRAVPPAPVELAATGPATIAAAAVAADRVMLTVGADPARVAWGIEVARQARIAAGLDPAALRVGAYVNVGCHPDPAVARALVRGSTAIFAHFSALSAAASTALSRDDAAVIGQVGRHYDEARHGLSDATHTAGLDDEFVDRFAVVGPAARCVARLRGLFEFGLDRVVVVPGSRDTDPELLTYSNEVFAREVLPQLRTALNQVKVETR
jgi:5,10-methylenetetrahydromethanopterin reductase